MRRHAVAIGMLLVLSAIVQAWSIHRAVTPALDAVRYAAFAQRIEREGWLAATRAESEHPLFPWLVAATHGALSTIFPAAPDALAASVQTAAAVPLVLPLYLLLLRSFGARTALAGGVLFCLLPRVARLGADGTSDSVSLLLCILTAWCVVECLLHREALRGLLGQHVGLPSAAWLAGAGALSGLALLARSEGLLLLAAIGVTWLCEQSRRRTRQSWQRWLAGCGGLAAGVALIWTPYLALVGADTPQRAIARVLGRGDGPATVKPKTAANVPRPKPPEWRLPDGAAMAFPAKESGTSSRFRGLPAAIARYAHETALTLHYWIGALAAYGVWTGRRQAWSGGHRFLGTLFAITSIGAIVMASRAGYLTTRHLMLLVPAALGPAARGAAYLGRKVNRSIYWLKQRWSMAWNSRFAPPWKLDLSPLLAMIVAGAMLPATLTAVHPSRIGHRRAAGWLATPGRAPGAVLDTRGLTGLYTGRPTRRYDAAREAFADPGLAYIVIEAGELQTDSDRARTLRGLIDAAGELAAEFPSPKGIERENVRIYRWRPEDFSPWMEAGRGASPRHVAGGGRSHE
jgi:hypothetical protein